MAIQKLEARFRVLSQEELDSWRAIPTTVAADCMNRSYAMVSRIKSIVPGGVICGQARTASVMVGDCGPICVQIDQARSGEVIVVDAAGVEDIAVWGGMMAEAAAHRNLGGAVVDGAVRDIADMRRLQFNMFCRAASPRGPHHGFGGTVDGKISAGGVSVSPGDIVLGDDDGVVIVPMDLSQEILVECQNHLMKEKKCFEGIRSGMTLAEISSAFLG